MAKPMATPFIIHQTTTGRMSVKRGVWQLTPLSKLNMQLDSARLQLHQGMPDPKTWQELSDRVKRLEGELLAEKMIALAPEGEV